MPFYDRRNFLRLSSWGLVATLLPLQQIKALGFIAKISTYNPIDYEKAIALAKKAKIHFYKKEYTVAEDLLFKSIELAPASIRFYDNLKAVYGAQGKYLEIIELFKNGLSINQGVISFYDRAARSLLQLEVGNQKLATVYKNTNESNFLLADSEKLYEQAIEIDGSKEYLKIGLKKVQKKIKEKSDNIDYRTNVIYKQARNFRAKEHKKRYLNYSIEALEIQLNELSIRKRETLYSEKEIENNKRSTNKEKRKIYALLIDKLKSEGRIEEALFYAKEMYELNPTDSEAIKKVVCLYQRLNDYKGLIYFRRQQVENYSNLYSYLGLVKALEKGYENGLPISLNECSEICDNLVVNWKVKGNLKISILDMKAKSYIKNNKPKKAIGIYSDVIENEVIKTPFLAQQIINGYATSLLENNEDEKAKNILNSVIYKEEDENHSKALQRKLKMVRSLDSKELISTRYNLHKVYKKQGDSKKQKKILREILSAEPKNEFAKKRM